MNDITRLPLMKGKDALAAVAFANSLIPKIELAEGVADEQPQWWGGFIAAIAGHACVSIGSDATTTILSAVRDITNEQIHHRNNT